MKLGIKSKFVVSIVISVLATGVAQSETDVKAAQHTKPDRVEAVLGDHSDSSLRVVHSNLNFDKLTKNVHVKLN